MTFKTYDGTPDKTEGKKFTVTPVSWNGATQAGTIRVVNFQLTHQDPDEEVKLVSIAISGKDEVRYAHMGCSNQARFVLEQKNLGSSLPLHNQFKTPKCNRNCHMAMITK